MKICIYGAGAIGGFLGAALARVPELEVTLIARGPHFAAIRERGLTITDRGQAFTVRPAATEDPEEAGPQDFVVVCLKAHQAWQAADRMAPLLGPETAVATCQNGVPWWYFHRLEGPFEGLRLASVDPGDRQWAAIGPERAIGCVSYAAAEITAPGVIHNVFGDKFVLGEPAGGVSARCRRLSAAIESAGLKAPILERIRDEIWLKLWGNLCFNPISALTRATLEEVAHRPSRTSRRPSHLHAAGPGAGPRPRDRRAADRRAGNGPHGRGREPDDQHGAGLGPAARPHPGPLSHLPGIARLGCRPL
jgi:2-dehydropantoate 2-reductase